MKQIKISKRQKEIIKYIGAGLLCASAIMLPGIAPILKYLKPKNRYEKIRIKKSYENLVNKGIIFLSGEKVKLSKKGVELYKKYEIEDIKVKKTRKWDRNWHLVSYDIPEIRKKQRDYFRFILQNLGFYKIQASLWVIPWECKEEIVIISQNIGVQPFVVYMNTNEIPNSENMMNKFGLLV